MPDIKKMFYQEGCNIEGTYGIPTKLPGPGSGLIMFDLLNNTTVFRYMDTQKDLFYSFR